MSLHDEIFKLFNPFNPIDKEGSIFEPGSPFRVGLASYCMNKYRDLYKLTVPPPIMYEKKIHNSSCSTCAYLYGIRRKNGASSIYNDVSPNMTMSKCSLFQLSNYIPSMRGRCESVKKKAYGHFSSAIIAGTSLRHTCRGHPDQTASQIDLFKGSLNLLREDMDGMVTGCIIKKCDVLGIKRDIPTIDVLFCLDMVNGREQAVSMEGEKITHPHSWTRIGVDLNYKNSSICTLIIDDENNFQMAEKFISDCNQFLLQNQSIDSMYARILFSVTIQDYKIKNVSMKSMEADVPFSVETKDSIHRKMVSFFTEYSHRFS